MIDISNIEGKTEMSRQRLKVIAEHIELFELLNACGFIEYRQIHVMLGVSHKTVERAINKIRTDEYAKDLIVEIKSGNVITICASNAFYSLIGSPNRCIVAADKKKGRISSKRRNNAVIRALRYSLHNNLSNKEVEAALLNNNIVKVISDTERVKDAKYLKYSTSFAAGNNLYEYEYDLLDFNKEFGLSNLYVDEEYISVDLTYVCACMNIYAMIEAYDKCLMIMERLKEINYMGCADRKININYQIVSTGRVDISEYIYLFGKSFRIDSSQKKMRELYLEVLGKRPRQRFFKIYKMTCNAGTKFVLYSTDIQKFVAYGDK